MMHQYPAPPVCAPARPLWPPAGNATVSGTAEASMVGVREGPSNPVQENRALRKKIQSIEVQHREQQKRLQQLERLVLQMSQSKFSVVPQEVPWGSRDQQQQCGAGWDEQQQCGAGWDQQQQQCGAGWDQQQQQCGADTSLLRDVSSIMEEFDQAARDHGITYGVTPDPSSCAGSEDLGEGEQCVEGQPPAPDCQDLEQVCAHPLPSFLTPLYQSWGSEGKENLPRSEPEMSPQLCLTTPVLLTTEALREAERGSLALRERSVTNNQEAVRQYKVEDRRGSFWPAQPATQQRKRPLAEKPFPFSNLLAGIQQKKQGPGREGQGRLVLQERPVSPCSSVSTSASERVRRWMQSVRLPLLSPLPDSHYSDPCVSDLPDLVTL